MGFHSFLIVSFPTYFMKIGVHIFKPMHGNTIQEDTSLFNRLLPFPAFYEREQR